MLNLMTVETVNTQNLEILTNILSPSQESCEDDVEGSPWGGGAWPEPGGATVVIENAGDEDSQGELESKQRGLRVEVFAFVRHGGREIVGFA